MDLNEMRKRYAASKEQAKVQQQSSITETYSKNIDFASSTKINNKEDIEESLFFSFENYDNGDWYEGQFNSESLYHGTGTYYFKNGDKLEGYWRNGDIIKGVEYSSDGERYEGEFNENWNYNGSGTYYYKDGRKLEGFWKNGEYISTSHSNNKTSLRKSVFIDACDKAINFLIDFERICYEEKKKSLIFVENIPIPYAYEAEWNQILRIWRTYVNLKSINTKTLSNPDNIAYNHRPYPITGSIGVQELIKEIRDKA